MDNRKTKQKVIVQIISLLISIGLWLYVTNTENPIRTVEVKKVPVQLLNANDLVNQGIALAPNQNIYVNLKIEGSSQDVYKVSANDFSIKIDLDEYALKVGDNSIPITFVNTPSNITVKNTSSLVVNVKIEQYVEKELEVESRIDVATKVSYYAAPPEVEPKTVTISGAESLVNQVEKLVVFGEENNVSEDIVKNYEVSPIDKNGYTVEGVKLSSERVQVTIRVNSGKSVPIKINTTDSVNNTTITSIKLLQEYVEIAGPKEILDNINEVYTEKIDLSNITKSTTLEVSLILPEGIEKASIYNVNVDIVINNKEENEEITKEFQIGLTTEGLSSEFNMELSANTVNIVLKGNKDKVDKINVEMITADIDLSVITAEGQYTETPVVNISGDTEGIEITTVDKVTVTISKKETTEEVFEEIPEEDNSTLNPES